MHQSSYANDGNECQDDKEIKFQTVCVDIKSRTKTQCRRKDICTGNFVQLKQTALW